MATFGRLDIVCANAGICPSIDTTPLSGFFDATDVDLIGTRNTVAATVPYLQKGASIILTGSTAGLLTGTTENIGASGDFGYMFAKHTVFEHLESIALLLAPHMIRANAIHPTNCDTDLLHNKDVYRALRRDLEHPTREDAMVAVPHMQAMPIPFLNPRDVSAPVLFLASDESRYLTGMSIRLEARAMLEKPPT